MPPLFWLAEQTRYNQKVIQASAGALAQVKMVQVTDWQALVAQAKRDQITLTALVVEDGKNITTLDKKAPTAPGCWQRSKRIPTEWLKDCAEGQRSLCQAKLRV